MKELQKVVRETIQRYQMIVPGDIVIAGVSGGPDSLTMLHLLKELQDDFDFRLHVAHVDHSFRGKEAEEEALWVKETAEKWSLPCTLTKINVPQVAREKGVSAQEAGHFIRKKFFFELLKKLGAQKIALGHQADDQAETVLMHFLVGAGLEGLQGIVPKNGPLIRPLLYLRREEIEAYCQENSLEPRRDPSNQQDLYLRNKIRQQVIPWLEEKSNPNLVETLNRTASILQADEDFLQKETAALAKEFMHINEKRISLSLADWGFLHLGMQRRLLRFAYKKLVQKQGLAFFHVEEVRNFIKEGQVGKVWQLPGKIMVEKSYGEILFYDEQGVLPDRVSIAECPLKIPGETFIPETGQKIRAEIVEMDCGQSEKGKVYWPWEDSALQLYARSRRAGDRFVPLGLQGSKKLKDFFIEKKIPRRKRDQLLLILAGKEIIWIPELALTEKCRIKSKNGKYLVLTIHSPS